jgi:hypothetical protein
MYDRSGRFCTMLFIIANSSLVIVEPFRYFALRAEEDVCAGIVPACRSSSRLLDGRVLGNTGEFGVGVIERGLIAISVLVWFGRDVRSRGVSRLGPSFALICRTPGRASPF